MKRKKDGLGSSGEVGRPVRQVTLCSLGHYIIDLVISVASDGTSFKLYFVVVMH